MCLSVHPTVALAQAQPAAPASGAPAAPEKPQPVELEADRVPVHKTKGSCLLKGGTVLTVTNGVIRHGDVLILNGKIADIGENLAAPSGIPIIDCNGKFVTPGIVDAHSHIGMDSVNEGSDSITAEVRMRDVIDPDAMSFYRALSNGVTSALLLHGSANAIGGQSVVVKLKWKHPVDEIVVSDAPRMIKFALGENVKRSNGGGGGGGGAGRFPDTRMGVEAVYRRGFEAAKNYINAWNRYDSDKAANPRAAPPRRDLRLEALADILKGNIRVQCHSYRADEMAMMLRLSKEFHFSLVLQHALEAYKITPEIVAAHAGVSTFADAWAYKVEANDAIPYNAALCMQAGIVTSVNSDNEAGTDRLNIEAANCMKFGGLSDTDALKLITINPAIQLGIEKRAGSLEKGKDGDVTVWSGYPLSVFSKCDVTIVEGETLYERRDPFNLNSLAVLTSALPESLTRRSDAKVMVHTASVGSIDSSCVPPVLPQRGSYAIIGAAVHPISSADIMDGTVIISDGKITSVGKNLAIPKGALIVRAKGLHVYPGLIDAGSVIGLAEIESIPATQDFSEGGEFQPDLFAATAINPGSEHFAIARNNGVTAAAVNPGGGTVSGQTGVINLAGWTPALMSVKTPVALHVTFPEPGRLGRFAAFLQPEQLTQMRERDTQRVKLLKDFFARAKTYAAARAAGLGAPDPELEAMIPYVTGKSPVVFAVNTAPGVKQAIQFAEDNGIKAILAGGADAWKEADLIAKKHIPYIYTITPNNSIADAVPTEEYDPVDTVWSAPAVLQRAGVKLCFQTLSASEVKNLPRQVGIMCAYGLPHAAALKALTINAAEVLAVADKMGSLESGKLANLMITDGDPMETNTHVCHLFIAGKPIRLESRHTQLYDIYKERLKEIR
jgi:imidazolonepropionase-like amidohydrolase